MKTFIVILSFLFGSCEAIAQSNDCYKRLFQRGIEEFNKGNFSQAILKWKTAKDDCPDATLSDKKNLDSWIIKATEKQKLVLVDTKKTSPNIKVVTKKETVIKTVLKRDTIYVIKRDTTYIDKPVEKIIYKDRPVEKIVYVDKPVEKIVYRDRPEPYHQFGKGNGKITLFKTCNCYALKFWIDGEYAGSTSNIFSDGNNPECGNAYAVSKIVLSGKHRVQGEDNEGHSWDFYVTVYEDQCLVQGVRQN